MSKNLKLTFSLLVLVSTVISCSRDDDNNSVRPKPAAVKPGPSRVNPADEKKITEAEKSKVVIPGETLVTQDLVVDGVQVASTSGADIKEASVKDQVLAVRALMQDGLAGLDETWKTQTQSEATGDELLAANNLNDPQAVLLGGEGAEITRMPQASDPLQTHQGLEAQVKFNLEKFAHEKLVPLVAKKEGDAVKVNIAIDFGDATQFQDSLAQSGQYSALSRDSFLAFQKQSEPKQDGVKAAVTGAPEEIKYSLDPIKSAETGVLYNWPGTARIEVASADQNILIDGLRIELVESRNLVVAKAQNLQQPAMFYATQYEIYPAARVESGSEHEEEPKQAAANDPTVKKDLAPTINGLLAELGKTNVKSSGYLVDVRQSLLPNPSLEVIADPTLYSETASFPQVETEVNRLSDDYWATRDTYVARLGELLTASTAKAATNSQEVKQQISGQVAEVQKGIDERLAQIAKTYDAKIASLQQQAGGNKTQTDAQIASLQEEKSKVLKQLGDVNFQEVATQKLTELKEGKLTRLQNQVVARIEAYKPESLMAGNKLQEESGALQINPPAENGGVVAQQGQPVAPAPTAEPTAEPAAPVESQEPQSPPVEQQPIPEPPAPATPAPAVEPAAPGGPFDSAPPVEAPAAPEAPAAATPAQEEPAVEQQPEAPAVEEAKPAPAAEEAPADEGVIEEWWNWLKEKVK